MGKTVMRPRMKRGISIAAAVACSFTLIPAVNAVQGEGKATPVANAATFAESPMVQALNGKKSIFDNPGTFEKLKNINFDTKPDLALSNNGIRFTSEHKMRGLYKENSTPLTEEKEFSRTKQMLPVRAPSATYLEETITEYDLGEGDADLNGSGNLQDSETTVDSVRVFYRNAGETEFKEESGVKFSRVKGKSETNSDFFFELDKHDGRGRIDGSGNAGYSGATLKYSFMAPSDFNGEVILSIDSSPGGYSFKKQTTERVFSVLSKENPYKPGVTDNNTDVTPKGKDLTTTVGELPDAKEGIANAGDLPDGTGYEWVKKPDVSQPGKPKGTIKVTEPNGKETEVEVTVTVTDPNANANTGKKDADKYTPQANPLTTPKGKVPAAKNGIKNLTTELPKGTTVTWQTEPNVSKPGKVNGVAKVTYPDKSSENVTVPVTVTDPRTDAQKTPAVGQDITTKRDVEPKAEDGIKNLGDLPKGTTATWEKKPDVSKPGETPATIKVTYPDKSTQSVPIKVHVTGDADEYTPKPKQITVPRGEKPKAEDGIANKDKLPKGTKYTWKTTPDTSKPGNTSGIVVVTYPDGSKDEVKVPIKVTSDADKYAPKPQDVATRVGVTPPASDGIANTDKLPKGTKYEWQKQPDVSQPGETAGTVKVTYPDGTSETVDVRVMVTQDIYVSDIAKQSNGDYKVTRNDGKTWTIDLHSLNDRISKNEKRINDLEKGVKANKGNIAKNKDAIDALRKETGELKKQVEGLKKSAQDADKRLDELEKQAKDQGKTLDTLVKENKAADDKLKNLTKQVTDLKKQQEVLKTRVSKLETRVTKLEADVKGLKDNAHAWAQCFSGIGTSAIPVLLALPLGLAAQTDVPGIGNVNAEIQKKLGIFNPAAAQWVSENRGIMQMAAGVLGFAGILGALVHSAQECGPYVEDDYVKDTDLGQLSSKMDSIKEGNAEGSSVEGGSSLGDAATEGGSSLGEGEGSSAEGSSEE